MERKISGSQLRMPEPHIAGTGDTRDHPLEGRKLSVSHPGRRKQRVCCGWFCKRKGSGLQNRVKPGSGPENAASQFSQSFERHTEPEMPRLEQALGSQLPDMEKQNKAVPEPKSVVSSHDRFSYEEEKQGHRLGSYNLSSFQPPYADNFLSSGSAPSIRGEADKAEPGQVIYASLRDDGFRQFEDLKARRIPLNKEIFNLNDLKAFLEGFKDVYLPSPENLVEVEAEMAVDGNLRMAGNETLSPLRIKQGKGNLVRVFRLADGRYLVPQPGLKSCTYASEAMLLLQQGYLRPDNVLSVFDARDRRREDEELIASLTKAAGEENVVIVSMHGDVDSYIGLLQDALRDLGPCIIGAGHAVVLDSIDRQDNDVILGIREPFHGTLLKLKQLETLPREQAMGLNFDSVETPYKLDVHLRYWPQAIFLKPSSVMEAPDLQGDERNDISRP